MQKLSYCVHCPEEAVHYHRVTKSVWKKLTDCVPSSCMKWRENVHLLLIHIHIQVDLGAQVEVEEGVDTKDKQ